MLSASALVCSTSTLSRHLRLSRSLQRRLRRCAPGELLPGSAVAGRNTERLISQSDSSHAMTSPFISTVQSSSVTQCHKIIDLYTALHKITIIITAAGHSTERLISQSDSSHATTSLFISTVQSSSVTQCHMIIDLYTASIHLTALFRDHPGEPVPER